MFDAINSFWAMLTTLISGTNRFAIAYDNLASVAEQESGIMRDKAILNRAALKAEQQSALDQL